MVRVGLVGFGMAGRVFHAPLISSVEGLQLTAVVERHSDQAAERYPGITTYRSLEQMLADSSLDLFVVATPSGTHFDVARQVLEAGKNTVIDKPVATHSSQIAELIALARRKKALLVPFHNRHWDGDFLTVRKLLQEQKLGRIVHFESRFDRWNPGATRRPWKDDPDQGGTLLDLGTHIGYQALSLFGKPLAVSADVVRERDGHGANDAFDVRLRFDGFMVVLGANALSSPPAPRFVVRGTKGNYRKTGVDPQEAALNQVPRITDPAWGQEPSSNWGTLSVSTDGNLLTQPVATVSGDYRTFYVGVRDAVLGTSKSPVSAIEAWRTARVLEWAQESADQRREIPCDWSAEPA